MISNLLQITPGQFIYFPHYVTGIFNPWLPKYPGYLNQDVDLNAIFSILMVQEKFLILVTIAESVIKVKRDFMHVNVFNNLI